MSWCIWHHMENMNALVTIDSNMLKTKLSQLRQAACDVIENIEMSRTTLCKLYYLLD